MGKTEDTELYYVEQNQEEEERTETQIMEQVKVCGSPKCLLTN